MASNKKDWALSQIRSRYESKFGASETVRTVLDSELSRISRKDKITPEDLNALEKKLTASSKASTLSLNKSLDSSPPKIIFSPKNHRFKSGEFDRNIFADLQQSTTLRDSEIYIKTSPNESYATTTLPPIATNHLHPMELKILKTYESIPSNDKSLSPTRTEESGYKSPQRGNLSPKLSDYSEFKLANIKAQEREKAIQQDIWKKLDEYNIKKAEEAERAQVEKAKKMRENWLAGLNKQMSERKNKKMEDKLKEKFEAQKDIEADIQLKVELDERARRYKNNLRSVEMENYLEVIKEKAEDKKTKIIEKEMEAMEVGEAVNEYLEDKRKKEEDKLNKRKILKSMKSEDYSLQTKKIQERIAQEKEENVRAVDSMIEKMKREEEKTEQFLKALKDRAKKIKEYEPAIEKGYDNLRRYGQLGKGDDHGQGVLRFLHEDRHDDQAKVEKKKLDQLSLKDKYMQQKEEQAQKIKLYKSYVEEQKDLWKEEEEKMNLREEVTAKVAKLKKQALREELDAQREADSPIKNQYVTPTEVWVNRKILKKLGAIPENHSDKISYLKGL